MKPIIDPRQGNIEDDASSPDRRSLLALAGSLLAEIAVAGHFTSWASRAGRHGASAVVRALVQLACNGDTGHRKVE
jgi:hypothetical protein